MKRIIAFLGGISLVLALALVGCVQPQIKEKPTAPTSKKEAAAAKVLKKEAKKESKKQQLYLPEIKPMTPAECGRCHTSVYETILKEGGKHQFQCTNCHKVYHVFRAAKIWNKIVPKCVDCHGYPHGKNAPVLKDCQKCHVEAHAPRRVPMSDVLEANCDKCHPKILAEMKKFPSKHAQQKCSFCHEKHGYIPSCLDCHEPHVASLTTNQQCLECHPVHSPTRPMVFKPDTSNEICSACHGDIVKTLAANKSKHHDVACVECHTKHGYIPKCQECHEQPHSAALLKKFPNCLTCHIDPHNLPTKTVSTGGKK